MKLVHSLCIFFLMAICTNSITWGQYVDGISIMEYFQKKNSNEGKLLIKADPLIEENLNRHIHYNTNNNYIPGFRIRIFSDSGFGAYENALSARTQFISKYENIGAYLQYDVPNYKVYVGDCRIRSEALKILEIVKKDFPYAFVVAQNINLTKD